MNTQAAVLKILAGAEAPSKYALAKLLKVQPIMISHYLNGSRMRQAKADIIKDKFNIVVTDVYNPTRDALEKRDST